MSVLFISVFIPICGKASFILPVDSKLITFLMDVLVLDFFSYIDTISALSFNFLQ